MTQHQCQQPEFLRISRKQFAQNPSEADGFRTHTLAAEVLARACAVPFVLDEANYGLHRCQTLLQPVGAGYFVRNTSFLNLSLGTHYSLSKGRFGE